ncbi:MAG: TIGR01244 family sulfur transferase [Burkholderiaceae bacterium]
MNPSLPVRPVVPGVYVAPQLHADAMADIAAAGFRSVINNRPDFEEGPQQPTNASVEAAARAAGLEYRFLPVHSVYQSPDDVAACAKLLAELPRPILAFCRSGARSTRLIMAASALS